MEQMIRAVKRTGKRVEFFNMVGSFPEETNRGRSIERALEKFSTGDNPSVIITRFRHWGCGWVDTVAVRVFKNPETKELTPAFKKLCQVAGGNS